MKMEANYDPVTGDVHLEYDIQAQMIFKLAWTKLNSNFDFQSSPLRKSMGEECDEDIVKPLKLLADFGSYRTFKKQVRPMAMEKLLGLICWYVVRLIDSREPVKPFDDALMLIANVTPIAISHFDLPPAIEVFDQSKTHPAAWRAFEKLRVWDKNEMPHLYAVEMLYLWQELKLLRRPNSSLKSLVRSLDVSIFLLREAFTGLAIKEVSGTSKGKKRK